MSYKALTGTLKSMHDNTSGEHIDIAELVNALNSRGYGPLLIGPAMIVILPTGAIPGMPSICALLIIFVSFQILIGRSYPWLPKSLKKFAFKRDRFLAALDEISPYTQKIDAYIYPRLSFLIQDTMKPIIAIASILLASTMIILGFIPFLAILPATGILLLGLGLTARDGLLFALSFAFCAGSLACLPYVISTVFGG